jgi:hypothetical protein
VAQPRAPRVAPEEEIQGRLNAADDCLRRRPSIGSDAFVRNGDVEDADRFRHECALVAEARRHRYYRLVTVSTVLQLARKATVRGRLLTVRCWQGATVNAVC